MMICPLYPGARVDRQAFRPTAKDVDGLSVYRARFIRPEQLDRDREGKKGRYYVAQLAVRAIKEIGLSVKPSPTSGLPGHSLIPEIRHGLDLEKKRWSKEKQLDLAQLASKHIIYSPPS